ncbi:MAG: hypothetical protein Q8P61_09190 [Candidatus Nanopelagicales bacterium]|nr:hypothetical protein [Candidatus Nanopelagicales bacterium]
MRNTFRGETGRVRWMLAAGLAATVLTATGCSLEARVAPIPGESSAGGAGVEPSPAHEGGSDRDEVTQVIELPNGVPLPQGGLIVSGPTPARSGSGVTGWSAVVTLSGSADGHQVREEIRGQISYLGWQVTPATARDDPSKTLSARRVLPSTSPISTAGTEQWLQVSVTAPLVDSGPAVVYRFAEAAQ